MKLLLVPEGPISFDGTHYKYSEGEGVYIDKLAKYFDEITVCAYAFIPGDDDFESTSQYSFKSTNINFISLPFERSQNPTMLSKIVQMISVAKVMSKAVKNSDIMYLFMPGYPAGIAYLASKLHKKPYFLYLASIWQEETEVLFRWSGIKRKLFLGIYHRINGLLEKYAVSNAVSILTAGAATLLHYKNLNNKIEETIPRLNWPEIKIQTDKSATKCIGNNLLYVGGLMSRKGVDYLIKAMSILNNQKGYEFRLNVVGSGPEQMSLEKLVMDLGLSDAIRFHGHISNGPKLYSMYNNSDIFVLPTPYGEGFPRVLYESMSQGLPSIATNVSGIPHKVVNEKTALLIEPRSENQIADSIERLSKDADLRHTISMNGIQFMRNLVENQDAGKQVERILRNNLKVYRIWSDQRLMIGNGHDNN